MWETMHCCNIWFGDSQNSIPNSVRRETKVWQSLIPLEVFHLEMMLFPAYAEFIAESGGPHKLNKCLFFAKWSSKSTQTDKNYGQCKGMHKILALALEKLHFESLL